MIRHVVSMRLAADTSSVREDHAARLIAALQGLPPQIPEILDYQIGKNALGAGKNWDLVLIADYVDADALSVYAAHPAHQKVLAYINEVVAERVAVDFLV